MVLPLWENPVAVPDPVVQVLVFNKFCEKETIVNNKERLTNKNLNDEVGVTSKRFKPKTNGL